MFVKLHKSYRDVFAICDNDLIGKKFKDGQKQLDVRESFYKGEEVEYEEAVKMIKFHAREDATFNIVGEESVKAAKEAGIVDDTGIGKIKGIPYAIVLL